MEYRYDEENRLVEIHYADGTWTKYAYDGYGRRVRKEESYWQNSNQQKVEVTQYLYDGLNVLMEFAGQDAPLAEYYTANGRIVMKKMFGYKGRKGHGNEDLLRTRGGFIYYHYDGLENVVDLTDQLGGNIDKYYYDAFGGFFAGILEPYNSYGLTGKEYDQKAGLYYFGARWYAPEAGRWMTQDIFRGGLNNPLSLHRFLYVFNNPLNYLDMFGFNGEQMNGKYSGFLDTPLPEFDNLPMPDPIKTLLDSANALDEQWNRVYATREGLIGRKTSSGRKIEADSIFVALPSTSALNSWVEVQYNNKTMKAQVWDVGPWNENDPYWETGTRPLAEKGISKSMQGTNGAGIDLSAALFEILGMEDNDWVRWRFTNP